MSSIIAAERDGVMVVSFSVKLIPDAESCGRIASEIESAILSGRCKKVILNFDGITFMSYLIVYRFPALRTSALEKEVSIKFCRMPESTLDIIQQMSLNVPFDTFDSEEEAMAAFD